MPEGRGYSLFAWPPSVIDVAAPWVVVLGQDDIRTSVTLLCELVSLFIVSDLALGIYLSVSRCSAPFPKERFAW